MRRIRNSIIMYWNGDQLETLKWWSDMEWKVRQIKVVKKWLGDVSSWNETKLNKQEIKGGINKHRIGNDCEMTAAKSKDRRAGYRERWNWMRKIDLISLGKSVTILDGWREGPSFTWRIVTFTSHRPHHSSSPDWLRMMRRSTCHFAVPVRVVSESFVCEVMTESLIERAIKNSGGRMRFYGGRLSVGETYHEIVQWCSIKPDNELPNRGDR